jgi:hypothetical protein
MFVCGYRINRKLLFFRYGGLCPTNPRSPAVAKRVTVMKSTKRWPTARSVKNTPEIVIATMRSCEPVNGANGNDFGSGNATVIEIEKAIAIGSGEWSPNANETNPARSGDRRTSSPILAA